MSAPTPTAMSATARLLHLATSTSHRSGLSLGGGGFCDWMSCTGCRVVEIGMKALSHFLRLRRGDVRTRRVDVGPGLTFVNFGFPLDGGSFRDSTGVDPREGWAVRIGDLTLYATEGARRRVERGAVEVFVLAHHEAEELLNAIFQEVKL